MPSYDASLEGSRYAETDLPEVLRHRLEGHGFIRIETGMFQSDRFAMPEEIASVTGDRVKLNVSKDKLAKA